MQTKIEIEDQVGKDVTTIPSIIYERRSATKTPYYKVREMRKLRNTMAKNSRRINRKIRSGK